MMSKWCITAAAVGLLTVSSAYAAENTTTTNANMSNASTSNASIETTIPPNSVTVTDWYKQDVFDPNNNKIGNISDVLVEKSGKITTLMIGVGGFLGAGEKDVAVPFNEVQATTKDNKMHLVMNATKDTLKNAPGFKYDSKTTTWVPDNNRK